MNNLIDFIKYDFNPSEIINISFISKEIKRKLLDEFNLTEESIITNKKELINLVSHILHQEFSINVIPQKIHDYFQEAEVTYDEDNDRICLIVDRDFNSFTDDQYEYVLQTCKDNNIEFYLSNPCFEFWLLLHYNEVKNLDKASLLKNEKENGETYAERQLKKLYPEYKKEKYDFKVFLSQIETAIRNAKLFSQDIIELQNKIGSNLGILINSLKNE